MFYGQAALDTGCRGPAACDMKYWWTARVNLEGDDDLLPVHPPPLTPSGGGVQMCVHDRDCQAQSSGAEQKSKQHALRCHGTPALHERKKTLRKPPPPLKCQCTALVTTDVRSAPHSPLPPRPDPRTPAHPLSGTRPTARTTANEGAAFPRGMFGTNHGAHRTAPALHMPALDHRLLRQCTVACAAVRRSGTPPPPPLSKRR